LQYFFAYGVQLFYSDIDECVQGLAGCSQSCNNTVGSYFCTCMDGFELGTNNQTCTGDYIISNYIEYCNLQLKSLYHNSYCLTFSKPPQSNKNHVAYFSNIQWLDDQLNNSVYT